MYAIRSYYERPSQSNLRQAAAHDHGAVGDLVARAVVARFVLVVEPVDERVLVEQPVADRVDESVTVEVAGSGDLAAVDVAGRGVGRVVLDLRGRVV